MTERDYRTRVDDGILVAADRLRRLRGVSLRWAIADFRNTSLSVLHDTIGAEDEQVWRMRIDRCDAILQEPDDNVLRHRVREAADHEK